MDWLILWFNVHYYLVHDSMLLILPISNWIYHANWFIVHDIIGHDFEY